MNLRISYESKEHKSAKKTLYDGLVNNKFIVKDEQGNIYKIFENNKEDEFLHMESVTVNYVNKPLYSSKNSPCFSMKLENPNCERSGFYGEVGELPCKKCLIDNKYENQITFTPDVAWGYEGEYKIWLEVRHTHGSSIHKIDFCQKNNIVLLEIGSDEILQGNRELIFENLTSKDIEEVKDYKQSSIVSYIVGNINSNGYISGDRVSELFRSCEIQFMPMENLKPIINSHLEKNDIGYIGGKTKVSIFASIFKVSIEDYVESIWSAKDRVELVNLIFKEQTINKKQSIKLHKEEVENRVYRDILNYTKRKIHKNGYVERVDLLNKFESSLPVKGRAKLLVDNIVSDLKLVIVYQTNKEIKGKLRQFILVKRDGAILMKNELFKNMFG